MLTAADPFNFILFGASGHLAKIKIYPALFTLAQKGKLPDQYNIVGFSRTDVSDKDFRVIVEESIRTHVHTIDEAALRDFLQHVYYHTGQYTEVNSFTSLCARLKKLEANWESVTRIGYFSVPPSVFGPISHNICDANLGEGDVKLRLIVEKPIGDDLASFTKVKQSLITCFDEDEVYLLDHDLGKEAVRNVYYLRYANPIIERIFKNTLIHHVEISRTETDGIDGRAGYFENTGTFRDMFQSHLLMVLSLLTMRLTEAPSEFRHHRKTALEQIYLPPATSLDDVVVQGQYIAGVINGNEVCSYQDEPGTESDSQTNTYAALKLMTRISRWEGVPFYLRSGKRLHKKEFRISVVFQEPHHLDKSMGPNRLDIILQGEAGIKMHLQTKMAGLEPVFRPLIVTDPLIPMGDVLPEHGQLLLEVIHGNKEWFLTFEEVHTAWRLVDPVQSHLEKKSTALHQYISGTAGPTEASDWIERDNTNWL